MEIILSIITLNVILELVVADSWDELRSFEEKMNQMKTVFLK